MPARDRDAALRERLAYEAARIMVEQGLRDFDRARRKAAERTGVPDRRRWPTNEAIQAALLIQRRLFLSPERQHEGTRLLRAALEAMRTFEAFSPRLVGDALAGTADCRGGIVLFLFADAPEDVLVALIEQRIPWKELERPFRYRGGERRTHPVLRFIAGDLPVELVVLPSQARRQLPLDPITDQPQKGASARQVEQMLAGEVGDA